MTTWVLLRGLMRDQRHWNGFDQRLRQKGLRVLTPDLPGNGTLSHELSPLKIADYAHAVWQQLDEQAQEGETIYLLGLSMGGMLALEMACQRPWQIRHVFVLNSSAANLSSWYQRFNPLNALKAFFMRARGNALHPIESTIVRLTSFRHRRDRDLIVKWSEFRRDTTPSRRNVWRQLWAAFQYQCPLTVEVPITVLCGDRDALVSMASSKALARHFYTDLIVLAYCGHDAAIDAPAKLAHYLLDIVGATKPQVQFSADSEPANTQYDCNDLLEEEIALNEAIFIVWDDKALSTLETE
ncbi:alpha/beta fold hydrolase [Shewanella sp. SM96]|uniref:alpha/beta fold hydrolase n=1 Tax=Shewanella TaxID=22 RepID=UPI0021DA1CE0|nr:alpha/beta hydrolase [Shewanella sp. SM96]MCU8004292.1 alpha/beta hydrolase [Shewanella sp. SM96]